MVGSAAKNDLFKKDLQRSNAMLRRLGVDRIGATPKAICPQVATFFGRPNQAAPSVPGVTGASPSPAVLAATGRTER
jgi:hypothetical protein